MTRLLLGLFVIAHGLVTAVIWAAPRKADAPFDSSHSWLLGDARSLSIAIALVVAVGFILAGIGYLAHQSWWGVSGIAAGAGALLLMVLYFNPWLLAGIGISMAILYAGVQALQQA